MNVQSVTLQVDVPLILIAPPTSPELNDSASLKILLDIFNVELSRLMPPPKSAACPEQLSTSEVMVTDDELYILILGDSAVEIPLLSLITIFSKTIPVLPFTSNTLAPLAAVQYCIIFICLKVMLLALSIAKLLPPFAWLNIVLPDPAPIIVSDLFTVIENWL